MTLISVVTPSFNQARYLEEAIQSVRKQGGADQVEHLVLDGGSTDGSADIIERHASWLAYWQSKPDRGQSAAINEGFRRAHGEIFCWVNSDDGLAPGAVDLMRATLGGCDGPAWAFGRARVVDDVGIILERRSVESLNDLHELLAFHNSLMQPAVFWNRAMWNAVGGLDENLKYVMDFDLWLRFVKVAPAIRVDGDIGVHRNHDFSKTSKGGVAIYRELKTVIDRHVKDSKGDYRYGLRSMSRDMTHHANASMYTLERKRCLAYLALALRIDPLAAMNRSMLKALAKLFNPFQPDRTKKG